MSHIKNRIQFGIFDGKSTSLERTMAYERYDRISSNNPAALGLEFISQAGEIDIRGLENMVPDSGRDT